VRRVGRRAAEVSVSQYGNYTMVLYGGRSGQMCCAYRRLISTPLFYHQSYLLWFSIPFVCLFKKSFGVVLSFLRCLLHKLLPVSAAGVSAAGQLEYRPQEPLVPLDVIMISARASS